MSILYAGVAVTVALFIAVIGIENARIVSLQSDLFNAKQELAVEQFKALNKGFEVDSLSNKVKLMKSLKETHEVHEVNTSIGSHTIAI